MLEMRSSRRLTTSRSPTSGPAPGYATPTNTSHGSTPVMDLTTGLGAGLAMAGSRLIPQTFGAGNHEMVDHVAAQTLLMIVFVSVVLGALGYLFSPPLLRLMGVTEVVYEGALGFM